MTSQPESKFNISEHNILPNFASLPLQIVLHYHVVYSYIFFIAQSFIYAYKGLTLLYPSNYFIGEVILLAFLCLLDLVRLFEMKRSNLLEAAFPLSMSMLLSVPTVLICSWLIFWQTYTLHIEVIFTAVITFVRASTSAVKR
ncbi:unnamed protein product [Dicrocoelium dendriticum]|nr:unnamed protein product [Dicrocoelium dendriticum]